MLTAPAWPVGDPALEEATWGISRRTIVAALGGYGALVLAACDTPTPTPAPAKPAEKPADKPGGRISFHPRARPAILLDD